MKKSLILSIFGILLFNTPVNSASTDGIASAVIVEQGAIEADIDMDFGVIIKPNGIKDDVILNTSNLITCPNSYDGWTCSGSPKSGKFIAYGGNGTYDVSYTNATLSDGLGNTMPLTINGPATITITNGTGELYVGGTLTVGTGNANSQQAGNYSTSNSGGTPYTVTINF